MSIPKTYSAVRISFGFLMLLAMVWLTYAEPNGLLKLVPWFTSIWALAPFSSILWKFRKRKPLKIIAMWVVFIGCFGIFLRYTIEDVAAVVTFYNTFFFSIILTGLFLGFWSDINNLEDDDLDAYLKDKLFYPKKDANSPKEGIDRIGL